jgi:hypothetical protein
MSQIIPNRPLTVDMIKKTNSILQKRPFQTTDSVVSQKTDSVISKKPDSIVSKKCDSTLPKKTDSIVSKKKLATATEMGDDIDIDLSDDDDDPMVKLSRSNQILSSKKDGAVSVPEQSTVFSKIAEQLAQKIKNDQAILAKTGILPGSLPLSGNMHNNSVPVRPLSSIGLKKQAEKPTMNRSSIPCSKTFHNSILTATSAKQSSGLPEHKDARFVGSIILSSKNLLKNSSIGPTSNVQLKKGNNTGKALLTGNKVLDSIHFSGNQGKETSSNKKNSNDVSKENEVKKKMAERNAQQLEIDLLLGKKSTHAEEREGEWFESFEKRTAKLAEKEEMQKKMAAVVHTFTKAYQCKDCNIVTESELAMQICTKKGHSICKVKAVKWFFECGNCRRKESTLSTIASPSASSSSSSAQPGTGRGDPNKSGNSSNNGDTNKFNNKNSKSSYDKLPNTDLVSGNSSKQHPVRRCECGSYDWRSASKYNINEGRSLQSEHRVVLTASDWTSKKDLASLDSMRSSVQ